VQTKLSALKRIFLCLQCQGKEVNDSMELLKRLLVEEDGQGLVEYTLIVVLVALVFWVAIKNTDIGNQLASGWSRVTACVGTPSACDSSS
jgi:Flp pilus assembly pilin Flp